MEGFEHIDELHDLLSILQNAAVYLTAMLHFQILSG